MSAFLCSDLHINTLITFASNHGVTYNHGSARRVKGDEQRAASLLQAQNARSVLYRYAHRPGTHCPPDPIKFEPTTLRAPIIVIKLCHCLDYQSCETPDWEQTEALALLVAIAGAAIRRVPGYDDAPWSI